MSQQSVNIPVVVLLRMSVEAIETLQESVVEPDSGPHYFDLLKVLNVAIERLESPPTRTPMPADATTTLVPNPPQAEG